MHLQTLRFRIYFRSFFISCYCSPPFSESGWYLFRLNIIKIPILIFLPHDPIIHQLCLLLCFFSHNFHTILQLTSTQNIAQEHHRLPFDYHSKIWNMHERYPPICIPVGFDLCILRICFPQISASSKMFSEVFYLQFWSMLFYSKAFPLQMSTFMTWVF